MFVVLPVSLRQRLHALMLHIFQKAHLQHPIHRLLASIARQPAHRHIRVRRRIFQQVANEAFGQQPSINDLHMIRLEERGGL